MMARIMTGDLLPRSSCFSTRYGWTTRALRRWTSREASWR